MTILICPVCKNPLLESALQYRCTLNHVFDKSRHGYVNLLLSNMKNSKEPGDNKEMVNSRTRFLRQGYYAPISELLNSHVKEQLASLAANECNIVDIGCGNGYYLSQLQRNLAALPGNFHYCGVDISKEAIQVASKESKTIKWLVSSIAELPLQSGSLQGVISIFSPLNFSEFNRLLTNDGYLFIIYPSSQHLYELRKILFADIKQIEKDRILHDSQAKFAVVDQIPLRYSIDLTKNAVIADLFSMTPYYWRCTAEKQQEVLSLDHLAVTVDVVLWIFKRS